MRSIILNEIDWTESKLSDYMNGQDPYYLGRLDALQWVLRNLPEEG